MTRALGLGCCPRGSTRSIPVVEGHRDYGHRRQDDYGHVGRAGPDRGTHDGADQNDRDPHWPRQIAVREDNPGSTWCRRCWRLCVSEGHRRRDGGIESPIALGRVSGIEFDLAVFTNLGHDHSTFTRSQREFLR